jgi:cytochrome c biogenesis protein CcdA
VGSRTRLLLAVIAALLLVLPATVVAVSPAASATDEPVVLTLFYGEGCPHCATEKQFLADVLAPAYPDLVIEQYEVWFDEANRDRMVQAASMYGFEPGPVPVTIVAGQVFVGFGPDTGPALESVVAAALADTGAGTQTPAPSASPPPREAALTVPVLGTVDLSGSPLLLSTLLIGLVDGVNPCSLWVLSVLLAIVLHSGSRGRVVLVGVTFLTVTAGMYGLYIAGLYTALDYLDGLSWIRVLVAAVALTFGVLQLKDGLAPGRGPSLSIPVERRPGLYQRMRAVASPNRGLVATMAGTVVLAIGVSLLETPCTAGLPLLWTTLLAEQQVPTATAMMLFAVYMTVFLLDELVVFALAVVTLRAMKLQERHGRLLKVIAGTVLVTLAVAMIAMPEAMQTLNGTLLVFGLAALLAAFLWWLVPEPQARRQRDSSVPSSASESAAAAKPSGGSAARPVAMRRAAPPTSTGATVRQSSSTRRSATRSPSNAGPPSHSSRRRPRSAR